MSPAIKEIIIKGHDIVNYASTSFGHPSVPFFTSLFSSCSKPLCDKMLFPGEYVTVKTISDFEDSTVAIEPRTDSETSNQIGQRSWE